MVDTEIERRFATLEKHEEESGAWHDRIIILERQYLTVVDWVQEQKQMQKRREDLEYQRDGQHRAQTRWLITLGVTIILGLAAIYFK